MKKVLLLLILLSVVFAQLPEYRLARGWNMVGGSDSPFTVSGLEALEAVIPPIYVYNPVTLMYEEADSIKPLCGYWIMCSESLNIGEEPIDTSRTVTDIDGNVYETINIGEQCWMVENLKVTHYRDGTPILHLTDATEWEESEMGAYCAYDNDMTYIETYGLLYNWYAVNDTLGLAPEGWHVATDEDWKQLEMALGMSALEADDTGPRGRNEGSKLAGREDLWNDGDLETDPDFGSSGIDLLPGGYRTTSGYYYDITDKILVWTSSEYPDDLAWYRYLYYTDNKINRYDYPVKGGLSVRCVKD